MTIFRKLITLFNKYSLRWVQNYPQLWARGWFTQLTIAAIVYFFALLLALLIPTEFLNTPDISSWFMLSFLPMLFWWFFILYRILKYNADKIHGNRKLWYNFEELWSVLFQLLLPFLLPCLIGVVLVWRTSNVIDINERERLKPIVIQAELLMHDPWLTYASTTCYYDMNEDFRSGVVFNTDYNYTVRPNNYYQSGYAYFPDKATFLKYISPGNNEYHYDRNGEMEYSYPLEWQQLTDSIYEHSGVFESKRPKLFKLNPQSGIRYAGRIRAGVHMNYLEGDTSQQSYYYNHYEDIKKITHKLKMLNDEFKKRKLPFLSDSELERFANLSQSNIYMVSCEHDFELFRSIKVFDYSKRSMINQLNYIEKAQRYDFFFMDDMDYYLAFLCFFACVAIIIVLFKCVNWKEFLTIVLGIAATFVLAGLFIGIVSVSISISDDFIISMFWLVLAIYVLAGQLESKSGFRRKRGALYKSVVHLILPVLPFLILETLDEMAGFWYWPIFDGYQVYRPEYEDWSYSSAYYTMKHTVKFWSVFGGFFMYFLVWYPLVLKPAWIKFLAKPFKS